VVPKAKKTLLPALDIMVEAGEWPARTRLKRIAGKVVEAASIRLKLGLPEGAELSIVFTDDAHIKSLNRKFRGKSKPTNVLSFPGAPAANGGIGPILGDIVLAAETVSREAEGEGLTLEAHLTHLILHGFLHILGYDHEDDGEASLMEGLETAILGGIGVADPYERQR
jgi:probable rRNA maturation factor